MDAARAVYARFDGYVPLGQFFQPAAMRDNVSDVLDSPLPIFWNARKG